MKTRVSDTFYTVKSKVGHGSRKASRATNQYVHDKPWRSLGLMALAACICGYLIGAKRAQAD